MIAARCLAAGMIVIAGAALPCHSLADASQSNHIIIDNQVLISGWNPSKPKASDSSAKKKTMEALREFKDIEDLRIYFERAAGYVVFPKIGKVGLGIGGARGVGEVFRRGKVIGSATVTQLSIGFQLGGQAFSQIIFFQNDDDLDRFTDEKFEFNASASAALITHGAATEAEYSNGVAVTTLSKGGLMYEASIGGQKFSFSPY